MAVEEVPKYLAIYRDLRARIDRGELAPGAQLASQRALANEYGVTLMTLRQAIDALADEGLVTAARGRGTFVTQPPFNYRLNHLNSFAQEMERQGIHLVTRVLSASVTVPDHQVSLRLGVHPQEQVFALKRLRLIEGRPVLYQESFLPAALGSKLDRGDLETRSLYDMLREEFGIDIARAVETLRPIALDDEQAGFLLRAMGTPCLLSERLSLASEDVPIIFDRAVLPGDAAVITAERVFDHLHLTYRMV